MAEYPTPSMPSMLCLECGYLLHDASASQCPECGREYDPDEPMSFRRALMDPVRLNVVVTLNGSHVLRGVLEGRGIYAIAEEKAAGVVERDRGEVWVDRKNLKMAQRIVAESPVSTPGREWQCPDCGEMVEPQFETCWACAPSHRDDPTGAASRPPQRDVEAQRDAVHDPQEVPIWMTWDRE